MATLGSQKRTRAQVAAMKWWAQAAYNGRDQHAALASLKSSGLSLKSGDREEEMLSAMARGDALMKGAVKFRPARERGKRLSAEYVRLVQWRLVMAYAGFEIFAKSVLGRHGHGDKKGLTGDDVRHLTMKLKMPEFIEIDSPRPKAAIRKWLRDTSTLPDYSDLSRFLNLNEFDQRAFLDWLHGTPITNHVKACLLAKALRNATAHGFLSPTKCHALGVVEAIRNLPHALADIRVATVCRLYEQRGVARRD